MKEGSLRAVFIGASAYRLGELEEETSIGAMKESVLWKPSILDYELPDFSSIHNEDLVPLFREGLRQQKEEIRGIIDNPDPADMDNTLLPLEGSGQLLERVLTIIFNYSGTMATPEIQKIEKTITPELAAHYSSLFSQTQMYRKLQSLDVPTGTEEEKLLEYWLRRFRDGGADLDEEGQRKLKNIDSLLAQLSTEFGFNLQKDTEKQALLIEEEERLAGLTDSQKEQLALAARERGKEGWLIALSLPTIQPLLEELEDPRTRAELWKASRERGAEKNNVVAVHIAALRALRAQLLGYEHHAAFVAERETAGSVEAVESLLGDITPAAVANAYGEYKRAAELAQIRQESSQNPPEKNMSFSDAPYWLAQLRKEDLSPHQERRAVSEEGADQGDTDMIREYFPLDSVLERGAFYAAQRLYGITMVPRPDLHGYHEDVQVWEIREEDGTGIGLLLLDYFARPHKRGGAWMSHFVEQNHLFGQKPVVLNVMNIVRPAPGEQALLSIDEVSTLFHEFGHGLHGLLSDVKYPHLSGTNVPRDFVEFPSQINENWALEPAVLSNYARHYETGEPLSQEMMATVHEASRWGQGVATTEYLASCWIDLAWHTLTVEQLSALRGKENSSETGNIEAWSVDTLHSLSLAECAQVRENVDRFEEEVLDSIGIRDSDLSLPLAPRYSTPYFNHIFAGGYSADYWSYLWAEVLDADGFEAFRDTGAAERRGETLTGMASAIEEADVRYAGERFRRMILSRGATIDFEEAFWMFRGKQKDVSALLERRGLQGSRRRI